MEALLRGMGIGLAVAAFPGPMTLLCIRRVLERGPAAGIAVGLGVATGDGIYAALGAFGVTAAVLFLTGYAAWLQLAGGLLLLWMGVAAMRAAPAAEAAPVRMGGLLGSYAAATGLTLSNPTTILGFAALFAGFGLAGGVDRPADAGLFVAGIALASGLWFLAISIATAAAGRRLPRGFLRAVGRGAGGLLFLFGAIGAGDALRQLAN